jgi:hypothetical protein
MDRISSRKELADLVAYDTLDRQSAIEVVYGHPFLVSRPKLDACFGGYTAFCERFAKRVDCPIREPLFDIRQLRHDFSILRRLLLRDADVLHQNLEEREAG